MNNEAVVVALSALAQNSRLAVFQALVEAGPDGAIPSELAPRLQLSPNTLSFHLKTLLHAGLITAEHVGRCICYRANFGHVQALVDFLTSNCCGGDVTRCLPVKKARATLKTPVS